MIYVSRTYEVITPDSAEQGEAAEQGYEFEDVPHTFRELVDLMQTHREPSEWPCTNPSAWVWFTSDEDTDFRTGEARRTSIHFSKKNDPRALKYWAKAHACAH